MPDMPIDRSELQTLCDLARLNLPAEREAEVLGHLQRIVSAFAALRQVPTDGITATAAPATPPPLRADRDAEALPRDEVLGNAPERAADCFVVPRVVGA